MFPKKIKITSNQLNRLQENTRWLIEDVKGVNLPVHLINAIQSDKTSLGNHPTFPPDDESKFVYKLLFDRYSDVLWELTRVYPDLNLDDSRTELSKLLKQCYDLEKPVKSQLEMLVMTIVKEVFGVDKDDVDLTIELVDKIQSVDLNIPLKPESVDDVEFAGIEEIEGVNQEIYKRRMVNCLMQGIANRFTHLYEYFVKDITLMNDQLFPLYKKIIILNEYNLFIEDGNILNENEITSGSTSEVIIKTYDRSIVNVKGINFISLLHESIRAMLDLISFNSLPDDRNEVKYILKKSDFRLADKWDSIFGYPLWCKIEDLLGMGHDLTAPLIPYIFYEIVSQPVDDFNDLLVNVFANTKRGKEQLIELYDEIQYNIEKDMFDMELEEKRKSVSNDDKYFNIDTL
jgi:hypothetical protein